MRVVVNGPGVWMRQALSSGSNGRGKKVEGEVGFEKSKAGAYPGSAARAELKGGTFSASVQSSQAH